MKPKAWLIKAQLPSPHEFAVLDRSKAEQYAMKYRGIVVPLVEMEERRKSLPTSSFDGQA